MTFAERRMISEAIEKIAALEKRIASLEETKRKRKPRQGEAHVVGQ